MYSSIKIIFFFFEITKLLISDQENRNLYIKLNKKWKQCMFNLKIYKVKHRKEIQNDSFKFKYIETLFNH